MSFYLAMVTAEQNVHASVTVSAFCQCYALCGVAIRDH